jgi:AraC family transcriptional regulator
MFRRTVTACAGRQRPDRIGPQRSGAIMMSSARVDAEGGLVISALNQLVDLVEEHLGETIDVNGLVSGLGTTEYHLRRMFSSLAGMPLSEYVRRRRMTVAAAEVVGGRADLLNIAVRHGYGSTEAFGRAFRAVHGASPGDVRRD